MWLYRGKIVKGQKASGEISLYPEPGKFYVSVPAVGDDLVEAFVCIPKNTTPSYAEGDLVFLAWFGNDDWVIMGCQYDPNSVSKLGEIHAEAIFADRGELGEDVVIVGKKESVISADRRVTGTDLIEMKRKLQSFTATGWDNV